MPDPRRVAPPPPLLFDDGSRIMTEYDEAPSRQQPNHDTSSADALPQTPASSSRTSDTPVNVFYEIDRLSNEIWNLTSSRQRTKDGWLCRVALQFPDELLPDAAEVCWAMEEALQQHPLNDNTESLAPLVFVLGDTTFGSCCPDEVSALHLQADVLVHYGHACLSPALSLPVLYSFGVTDMYVGACVDAVLLEARKEGIQRLLLLYEVRYHHAMDELQVQLSERGDLLVLAGQIPQSCEKPHDEQDGNQCGSCSNETGTSCQQEDSDQPSDAEKKDATEEEGSCNAFVVGGLEVSSDVDLSLYTVLFVGDPSSGTSGRQYVNTMLRFLSSPSGPSRFWTYSPTNESLETSLPASIQRQLNRRFYLTQKARDASVFGILVGTLSQRHFRSVVSSLRRLIEDAGRASYTFAVGKINGAKLANFAEIDCYVLVACGENSLLDGERDLHVPVITPLELDIAFGNIEWGSTAYSLDYNDFLSLQHDKGIEDHESQGESSSEDKDAPYFSLVKGAYVDSKKARETDMDLAALPGKGQLTAYRSEASEYLKKREYKGLETKLGQTEAHAAVPGQDGIASNYGEETRNKLQS